MPGDVVEAVVGVLLLGFAAALDGAQPAVGVVGVGGGGSGGDRGLEAVTVEGGAGLLAEDFLFLDVCCWRRGSRCRSRLAWASHLAYPASARSHSEW